MIRTCIGLIVVCLFAACEDKKSVAPAAVVAPKRPTVVFLTEKGEVPVQVDIADTPGKREQGLMWVEHMPEDHGMVFLMGPERVLTFWMKNTYIPLDMIFVSGAFEVVGVAVKAEPLTLDPRRVDKPSSYVVEVNGGWAERHGVGAGTKVRFDNVL